MTKVLNSFGFLVLFRKAHPETPKCPRRSRTRRPAQGHSPSPPAQGHPPPLPRTRSAQGFGGPCSSKHRFGPQPYGYRRRSLNFLKHHKICTSLGSLGHAQDWATLRGWCRCCSRSVEGWGLPQSKIKHRNSIV